jgi:hypothetical protein
LNVLYIWHSNCRLFNACLTEMRSRAPRCECDFGRSFTHHFWSHFGAQFYPFFGVPSLVDFPVLLGFLRLGGGFRPVFGRVLDRTFLFIFGHFGITSRTVFERQIFVTIPSLRMDSPSLNRLLLAG